MALSNLCCAGPAPGHDGTPGLPPYHLWRKLSSYSLCLTGFEASRMRVECDRWIESLHECDVLLRTLVPSGRVQCFPV